ncbi:MAG TPA: hypothetical protein VND96_11740 [Candidatus Micrarchaeaceae archaeon]|nr:hypothetical protein [Candidatus Micrarchaeaceae archaeon]
MLFKVQTLPSLEARLIVIRRRRRRGYLKQAARVSPAVIGASIVLLVAFGAIVGLR